ncbi:MAG: D-alanyl-D-alanine carboxypeptidase [Alphaproteobacteria bacterium]|nr:D-alanyl-D-alanine carboxypeptidase [Alphaproteobacteria bacterium]
MLQRLMACFIKGFVISAIVIGVAIGAFESKRAEAGYAAIVVDQSTGEILHERNADEQNYPASLTKMMTLYMVFTAMKNGRLKLETPLKVSENAATQPPSNLGLDAGSTIKVEEAILALVTKSANDVAVVVAEALAGSEEKFAQAMTKRARKLGMKHTVFRNASGLPDKDQVSSARDMARLAIALKRDYPKYYKYFSTESFVFNGRRIGSHNHLIGAYEGTDGIKTGYIRASGYNLVASAEREGRRLVAVVLGGDSIKQRDQQVMSLLDSGFGFGPEPADLKVADRAPITEKSMAEARKRGKATRLARSFGGKKGAGGAYAIQVGSYDTKKAARQAVAKVARKAGDLVSGTSQQVNVVKAKRGKTSYRAVLAGLSKVNAEKACRKVERAKMPCLVIKAPKGKGSITVASLD